jgi:pimeloyl-ACP methyl ester carboxylesterase
MTATVDRGVVLVLVIVSAGWLVSRGLQLRSPTKASCEGDGWVRAGLECLRIEPFRSRELSTHPTVLVVLHGDSPALNPSYQYDWARRAAKENRDLVAIGMLRPGYADRSGGRSSGVRGKANGDNYTPAVIDTVTDAVTQLKRTYGAKRVVIAGHSGGAAIAGAIMGRHPGVADAALLVSCPCDVPQWRVHMQTASENATWSKPVETVSPIEQVNGVDGTAHITMIVGQQDLVTPPSLSRSYRDRLRSRFIDVNLIEVAGGHDIFFDGAVRNALVRLLQRIE